MKGRLEICAAVLALAVSIDSAARAEAQASMTCFEVVPAQAGVQPAILIDRCSGRTWQLVRRAHAGGYRWRALSRDGGHPAPAAAPATGEAKCFTFEGRKFCE
jgi:hypothetical protein